MLPVPEIKGIDLAFGNIDHLPKMKDIPEELMQPSNRWMQFVSKMFFVGLKKEEYDSLVAKQGVDKKKAFMAIRTCLLSFEPKHEHKEAGCAMLFNEWFEPLDHDTKVTSEELNKIIGGK